MLIPNPQSPIPNRQSLIPNSQLIEHGLIYIGLIEIPEFYGKLLAWFSRICDTLKTTNKARYLYRIAGV
jgi:hypothetical protein